MENNGIIAKVRWSLRFKNEFGWNTVMTNSGIRYWDSFEEMATCVAKRVDAQPGMQFQFVKEVYHVKA